MRARRQGRCPKLAPDDRPAHHVQRFEQVDQHLVVRRLRDREMEIVVPRLVGPPVARLLALAAAGADLVEIGLGAVHRRQARKLGLDRQPRLDHLDRTGELFQIFDVVQIVDRTRAHEGPASDLAPDQAVVFQIGQRLAQLAARDAQRAAERALGRQSGIVLEAAVDDVPPKPFGKRHMQRSCHRTPIAGLVKEPAFSEHRRYHIN